MSHFSAFIIYYLDSIRKTALRNSVRFDESSKFIFLNEFSLFEFFRNSLRLYIFIKYKSIPRSLIFQL